jgi:predicted permease
MNTAAKEERRRSWRFASLDSLLQDVRYGLRMLRMSPGFTAVAMLTLALGIGANTAIFSLIDAVMFRSLPVKNPQQLVLFQWQARQFSENGEYSGFGDCERSNQGEDVGCSFPLPFVADFRSQTKYFSGVVAFAGPTGLELTGEGPASHVSGELVSGDFFSTLGVNAILGRTLGPGDDSQSASATVALSYAYWQRAFGGNRSVLGRAITLDNVPFTIVGVAEPSFTNLSPGKSQDLFLPISTLPRLNVDWGKNIESLQNWSLVVLGRLRPGVSRSQAQAAASVIFRNQMLDGANPLWKGSEDLRIALLPAQEGLTGSRAYYSTQLYVLMFAVGTILLIACANVAGLLLARAATRQKEIAVRLALGAGHRRIMRQLLTESLLLSAGGGAFGIAFAYWGVHLITALMPKFPFIITPDWRVLTFVLAASLLTGILFGLAPALRSIRLDLTPALKESASLLSSSTAQKTVRLRLGSALVILQVALSVLVLIGAGLLVRTFQNLRSMNPGFDPHNVLLFAVDPTIIGYKDAQIADLYRDIRDRLSALPGVISVSYSSDALLSGGLWTGTAHLPGRRRDSEIHVDMLAVGPDFLRTMHIPLLEGRALTSADFELAAETSAAKQREGSSAHGQGSPKAQPRPTSQSESAASFLTVPVLVNSEFVREYLAHQNPLGIGINRGPHESSSTSAGAGNGGAKSADWQIVGVVGDTKYNNLRRAIHPMIFVPITGGSGDFELRAAMDPRALIPVVRNRVSGIDKNLPLTNVRTQTEQIGQLLVQERLLARISTFFGLLAVALACIGLYGLLSFEVARRTREIGIRMALGAFQGNILRLVLGQGILLAILGAIIGTAAAAAVTRYLGSLLYGVKPIDAPTFIAVAVLLIVVAIAACYVPARRATRVDPMVALRYE